MVDVQTNEEATVSAYNLVLFLTVQILEDTPTKQFYRLESSAKITDIPKSGPVVKNTFNQQWQKNPVQDGEFCTDRCPGIIDRFFQLECNYVLHIVTAGHIWWYIVESSNNTKWRHKHSGIGKPFSWSYRNPKHKLK